MHEASLARQILSAVLAEAQQTGTGKVTRVSGWIAETERLSTESLRMHFRAASAGGPAGDAELDLEVIAVEARCAQCGSVFEPDHHVVLCPECGSTDATLSHPTGFAIETIEVS